MKRLLTLAVVTALANVGGGCRSETTPKAAPTQIGREDKPSALGAPDADLRRVSPPTCTKRCDAFAEFSKLSNVPYDLDELSGLAVSRKYQGVLYAHNDSGDAARIFAFGTNGAPQGEFKIEDATAIDWEDIGAGPCQDGSPCLYIGDIGDNENVRQAGTTPQNYAIYVVAEPALNPDGGKASLPSKKLAFVYPDGARNAEALLVDPRSGDLFVVTKNRNGQSTVYQYPRPYKPGETATLTKIADFSVPSGGDRQITGGALHPCELRVVLRTYTHAFELVSPRATSLAEVFKARPRPLAIPIDLQGEAITYDHAGTGVFTSSEAPLGGAPPLRHADCATVTKIEKVASDGGP